MPHRSPAAEGTHDRLLVFGAAAVVLGVVLVSQGVLPSQPAAYRVLSAHATLLPAEHVGPAPGERLVAETSPATSVPPTPPVRTATSGATGVVAACPAHFALDRDLRQELMAMALQRRVFTPERPVAPNKGDVPASVLILAERSVARAEASPRAVEPPIDGGDALRLNPSRDCAVWSPGGELNPAAPAPTSTASP